MAGVATQAECTEMYKHILMAVDVEAPWSWKQALPVVRAMAECFSARVTICTVATTMEAAKRGEWWPISYQDKLAEKRAELDAIALQVGGEIPVDVEVGTDSVSGGIVDVAERIGADLIALSSHQHKLVDLLVSPHAARVSRMANCSVLVMKSASGSQN
jgi:nucleotide-binding universal stress UspA family protein